MMDGISGDEPGNRPGASLRGHCRDARWLSISACVFAVRVWRWARSIEGWYSSAVSRYDLFRRRIAPIAFFIAIALIAKDSCEKDQRTHTTVELELGAERSDVRAVNLEVFAGEERVAAFYRAALPDATIGPCRFELALAQEDVELRIDIDRGARHQTLTRRLHAIEGSTTMIAVPAGAAR